jgi:hypothetical protein
VNYHYQNTTTVKTIRREVRKRGFFGWVFLVIFWLFNALMVWFLYDVSVRVGTYSRQIGATEYRTTEIALMNIAAVLFFWALGSVITGLLAYFTRGPKTIIEETIE